LLLQWMTEHAHRSKFTASRRLLPNGELQQKSLQSTIFQVGFIKIENILATDDEDVLQTCQNSPVSSTSSPTSSQARRTRRVASCSNPGAAAAQEAKQQNHTILNFNLRCCLSEWSPRAPDWCEFKLVPPCNRGAGKEIFSALAATLHKRNVRTASQFWLLGG
jgi:hypothetical protein